jgi:3D-(3,5/4)-trihydroxycyclohexane-1,2-dione acylhydrolase (decyclizing)
MGKTIRLTMAQAIAHFLKKQMTVVDGKKVPIFGGVWAIFGHGNVAGMGEALYQVRGELPTYRAHNEQGMAHAAIAYAKASFRQRFMACTTSIGPGALNMVTAAGVAHVNRVPVLFLPGDVFASRAPDPVLQQIEDFGDGTVSANDAFRPVSRYFDRITRPEQIISALKRAMQVLTDPLDCGPVTLSLCQDVQAEAFDYPESFFEERIWTTRRPRPDADELANAIALIKKSEKPVIIAGGGVLYSRATKELTAFAEAHGIPVVVTQAGKSAIDERHPLALGSVGVTGTSAANALAEETDLLIAVGTRCQDFTTGSWALFKNEKLSIIGLNIAAFDAVKHDAHPLVADAREGLKANSAGRRLEGSGNAGRKGRDGKEDLVGGCRQGDGDDQCGAALRCAGDRRRAALDRRENTVALLRGGRPAGRIAQALAGNGARQLPHGIRLLLHGIRDRRRPRRQDGASRKDVVVMVGDGSYMMLNSEIATSVMLGLKLNIVLLDNSGYGCINRLQMGTGGANFNNLLKDSYHEVMPEIDFRRTCRKHGRDRGQGGLDRELERRSPIRGRTTAPRCSSSIPIRLLPPRPAATGGMSRCRK